MSFKKYTNNARYFSAFQIQKLLFLVYVIIKHSLENLCRWKAKFRYIEVLVSKRLRILTYPDTVLLVVFYIYTMSCTEIILLDLLMNCHFMEYQIISFRILSQTSLDTRIWR